jgi:hypothetical protein
MKIIGLVFVLILGMVCLVSGATTSSFYEANEMPYKVMGYANGTNDTANYGWSDNFDLFDDSFSVGDCLYFGWNNIYNYGGMFTGITMNVTTPISADSWRLDYQYCATSSGGYCTNWLNLSQVGDDTEMFSRVGKLGVGFEDKNTLAHRQGGVSRYYYRVCVAEVTNPTEGGHIGNGNDEDGLYWSPQSTMVVTGGTGNLNDLVNDDLGVIRYNIKNRSLGGVMNLSVPIQSPANKPIPITFELQEMTGDWELNITYLDGDNNYYNHNISGTGNYEFIMPFLSIEKIDTIGLGRLTLQQDRFGCIDRSAYYPSDDYRPEEYFLQNCVVNISGSSTITTSNQVLLMKGFQVSDYGQQKFQAGNGYGFWIDSGSTLNCGTATGNYGDNVGIILTSRWVGWNEMANYGTLNMKGCVYGNYEGDFYGHERQKSGIDLIEGSTTNFIDAILWSGSRLRAYGVISSATRMFLFDWGRIETYHAAQTYNDLVAVGASTDYQLFGQSALTTVYDGNLKNVYAYSGGNVNLVDTIVEKVGGRVTYNVNQRHRFNVTVTDYKGNPIKGAEVNLYDKNGDLAVGSVGFPILTDSSGSAYSEVTFNNTITTSTLYKPFSLKITKEGYLDYKADNIPFDDKFITTITMNQKGIYPNINSLDEEYR